MNAHITDFRAEKGRRVAAFGYVRARHLLGHKRIADIAHSMQASPVQHSPSLPGHGN